MNRRWPFPPPPQVRTAAKPARRRRTSKWKGVDESVAMATLCISRVACAGERTGDCAAKDRDGSGFSADVAVGGTVLTRGEARGSGARARSPPGIGDAPGASPSAPAVVADRSRLAGDAGRERRPEHGLLRHDRGDLRDR